MRLCMLLLYVLTSLSSCMHLAQAFGLLPQKPEIALKDVSVKSLSFSGIELDVAIDLENKDVRPLFIAQLDFELWMNESAVARGQIPEALNIAPQESRTIGIPIKLKPSAALAGIIKSLDGKTPDAKIVGSVTFNTALGALTLPFEREIMKASKKPGKTKNKFENQETDYQPEF